MAFRKPFAKLHDHLSHGHSVAGGTVKGRIACSADRLGLLDEAMISSVVEPHAFQVGKQYYSERRVQIVDASDTEVTTSVMGNSGLYEQSVRLYQGHLEARCSCPLPEKPLCRHGIAALLEYHRWAAPRSAPAPRAVSPRKSRESIQESAPAEAPSADVKLSELTHFSDWMQRVVQAIQEDQPVPDQPALNPGVVSTWIHIIRQLDERRRESETAQIELDTDVRRREAMVARLTSDLEGSAKEVKSLQTVCKDLQHEIDQQKAAMGKTAEVSRHVETIEVEIKTLAGLLADKGRRLEGLSDTCRDVASMLKSLDKR